MKFSILVICPVYVVFLAHDDGVILKLFSLYEFSFFYVTDVHHLI